MKQPSAGLLLYRRGAQGIEVLLVHPGGPFWAKKDLGAWSIPKGRHDAREQPLEAAKREFQEETGQPPPSGDYINLGEFKRSDGTMVKAWAIESDFDTAELKSNMTTTEWPPGHKIEVPEVDRADWVELSKAPSKLHKGQEIFIKHLAEHLGADLSLPASLPSQASLF